MSAIPALIAVGVNLGAATLNIITGERYRRRLKELNRGHRESHQGTGSGTGAVQAAASGERAGGENPGAGLTPEPVAEEIIAQRGWQLSQDATGGPVLYSVCHCVAWSGPTLIADRIPAPDSPHGIYAQRQLETGYKTYVWGEVALSGRVVEGENGYRAERATIRSLVLRTLPPLSPAYTQYGGWPAPLYHIGGEPLVWKKRAWEVADQLAERYQCEVTIDWVPKSELPAEELTI